MTRGKVISTALAAAVILGVFVDVIAVTKFGFDRGNPFSGRSTIEGSSTAGELVTPNPTLEPTATATTTPIPPLGRQLQEALSVSRSSAKSVALSIAAQDAVLRRDYWTAIRAASATPYNSSQAENLAFVVRCAIEDQLFDFAAEAADKVRLTSDRDRLKIEVIEARREVALELSPNMSDRASRESMACFSSPKE